jgi:hypothetical protein
MILRKINLKLIEKIIRLVEVMNLNKFWSLKQWNIIWYVGEGYGGSGGYGTSGGGGNYSIQTIFRLLL